MKSYIQPKIEIIQVEHHLMRYNSVPPFDFGWEEDGDDDDWKDDWDNNWKHYEHKHKKREQGNLYCH